jgi:hypothetical protein
MILPESDTLINSMDAFAGKLKEREKPEHTSICIGRGGTPGPEELCPACADGIERILERWYPGV